MCLSELESQETLEQEILTGSFEDGISLVQS